MAIPGRIAATLPLCRAGQTRVLPCRATVAPPRSYATASLQHEKLIHYKVLMEPIGTNVFFLAPWAFSLRGDYRLITADSGGSIYDYDFQHAITRYEATSDIATPTAPQLARSRT